MKFGSFVLSGIYKCSALFSFGALSCFVLPPASLSLRKFRCFKLSVLAHNKGNQFAPGGAGRSLRSRRCCRRYATKR